MLALPVVPRLAVSSSLQEPLKMICPSQMAVAEGDEKLAAMEEEMSQLKAHVSNLATANTDFDPDQVCSASARPPARLLPASAVQGGSGVNKEAVATASSGCSSINGSVSSSARAAVTSSSEPT